MKKSISSKAFIKAYYVMFAFSAASTLILMMLSQGKNFAGIMFEGAYGSDFFMDFFNSMRDASSKDVYKEGIIYPPLANMFFYALSRMIDPYLANSVFMERLLLQLDYTCVFLYVIFAFLSVMLFINITMKKLNENGFEKISFSLPLLLACSYPMLYCFQRGNIALISFAFSMFFVLNRNSENKLLRELSFVLLAVAAGLKLYPAAFGLLLLTDKKYKEAARLVVYGVLAIVLPFFFYDGTESIKDLLANLSAFGEKSESIVSLDFVSVDVFAMYLNGLFGVNYDSAYYFLLTLTYLCAVLVLLLANEEWQKVWAICFMIMNYTSTARTYILIMALIPFFMFISKKVYRRRDIVYFVLFAAVLVVIPAFYINNISQIEDWISSTYYGSMDVIQKNIRFLASPNQLLAPFALSGMTVFMFADVLVRIARNEIKLKLPKLKKK